MLADLGFSMTDYISVCILLMGFVASSAVGGYVAFLVIKRGLRWLTLSLSSDANDPDFGVKRKNYATYEDFVDAVWKKVRENGDKK